MQIIPICASRPALAPAPIILPRGMDELLSRRKDARGAAEIATFVGLDRHARIHRAFAERLTRRINAQVDA